MSGVRTQELARAPGLLGLYARALVPRGATGGAASVPDIRLALRAAPADRVRLRRYAEVCGFPDRQRLPATYPHLVAFPLAMALMTRRDFPFPLLGLVHIANRIEQRRPLSAAEWLSYEVGVRRPYGHPKGTAFKVVAEASAGPDVVWRSVSTYLYRCGSGAPRPGPRPVDSGAETDGELAGGAVIDGRWGVPASTGRAYAAVSGDRNPIHLHPLAARPFGFPGAVAHGMWTKARCLAALDEVLPGAFKAQVAFRAPLLLPGEVRFRAAPAAPSAPFPVGDGQGWAFEVCGEESGRRHLSGSVTPLG
ncbi:MaoC/PaaZ C-terminal domain-containing protein [Streptomyces sp. GC420]|uniref:MaoC family dehydratase n=1 Tax=Streptomyces sp. GC420 TaxID=2697568 RepID=UPI0028BE1EB1|nr:MaoC/PaaZ C-terminal domain-containing protein [Streptomyces sp. GC420]